MKAEIGDMVKFRGRKWLYYSNIRDKAYLVLLPGQRKPYRSIKGYLKTYDTTTTNPENLTVYE